MKILVIGSGGREHAVIKALKKSANVEKIFAAPGNGGIAFDAECVDIKATDIEKAVNFAKDNSIDFCVVTPDDPLVLGMADAMEKAGIPAFGPSRLAAEIEGSKVFSKWLMKKYGIPTADYETFDNSKAAIEYVKKQDKYPVVIKADGLALGKGVCIAESFEQAQKDITSIMEDKVFGESGNHVVIEEFLTGPEVSVLSFTDSKTIVPMVSAMDHKRALEGDKGLNTGGMGTIAPNPLFTKEIAEQCMDEIFVKTMNAMNSESRPFKGCIFFGLMLTPSGPKVIEYNCRFGDPEAQSVLSLLKGDLLEIMQACRNERLSEIDFSFENKYAACVVLASGGYPEKYETGKLIEGLDSEGGVAGASVFHAGTKKQGDEIVTSGGRVMGVTALGDSLEQAIDNAYAAADKISFDKAYCRRDIGKRAIELSRQQ